MGKLSKDAKDLLVGNDGSDKEPKDFKTELQEAIENGVVKKADGTLLIQARENGDKLGKAIDDRQIEAVRKINVEEVYDSAEEELEAKKKKEAKKKEQERKRREKEAEMARKKEESAKDKSKSEKPISQKEREN